MGGLQTRSFRSVPISFVPRCPPRCRWRRGRRRGCPDCHRCRGVPHQAPLRQQWPLGRGQRRPAGDLEQPGVLRCAPRCLKQGCPTRCMFAARTESSSIILTGVPPYRRRHRHGCASRRRSWRQVLVGTGPLELGQSGVDRLPWLQPHLGCGSQTNLCLSSPLIFLVHRWWSRPARPARRAAAVHPLPSTVKMWTATSVTKLELKKLAAL